MRNLTPKRIAKHFLCKAVAARNDFDPSDALVIFSDPRGGSTWLMEAIHRISGTAVIWEPLQIHRVREFRSLGFSMRQFIPEDADWPEAENAFRKLFQGKVLNNWICNPSSPLDYPRAEKLIIKFCRANGMIPWLVRKFNFKHAPIYLVRHPLSVVASQLKHGSWDYKFEGYQIPAGPFTEPYRKHREYLLSLKSKEEALVATWCITNAIPLKHRANDMKWITVYYEDLLMQPNEEFDRIFSRWGIAMPEDLLDHLRTPSARAKEKVHTENARLQLSKWQDFFSSQQVNKMIAVIEYFQIRQYGRDILPLR